MKYFDDMQDKFGFGDGDIMPPDAYESREVYVQALNMLAAKYGSQCRVAPYDRPGMHNSCKLVLVAQAFYEQTYRPLFTQAGAEAAESALLEHLQQREWAESIEDSGWQEALTVAHDLVLDEFVETRVSIAHAALNSALAHPQQRVDAVNGS